MHIRKPFLVVLALVIVLALISFVFMKKQTPAELILEEEMIDLPQKPSISLDTYIPIVKDTIWNYKNEKDESTFTSWVEFINDETMQIRFSNGEKSIVKVYVEEEDAIYEVATVEDVAIKENYTTLRQYKDIIMKLPLTVGNSWILSDGAIRTVTKVDENYETPAGIQKSIEITTLHDDYKVKEIYAEKVGLVELEYESNEKIDNFKLHKIDNNTARDEQVTLYMAQKKVGVLDKLQEKVAVMTNEEPKHFLTDLLKKVEGTEYITAISNGATIDKIFMDDEACLYVEMSGAFIDSTYNQEEQKGAVMSLVQTLGHYYNATHVVITIDGEVYRLKGGQADARGRIRVLGGLS